MTFCVQIVTASGIVLCSDSLVSISKRQNVITEPRDLEYLSGEKLEKIHEILESNLRSPVLTPSANIVGEDTIVSTSPNVQKTFQVGKFPFAFCFAGSPVFQFHEVRKGKSSIVSIPLSAYVTTVVEQFIDQAFENQDQSVETISKALAYSLSSGYVINHKNFTYRSTTAPFDIMGAGYSPKSAFPEAMWFTMPGRKKRSTILSVVGHAFATSLSTLIPLAAPSVDWFNHFLKDDLLLCLHKAHISAWIWSQYYEFELEQIKEQIIPDVNSYLAKYLAICQKIYDNDPRAFLNKDLITPSSIQSFVWNFLDTPDFNYAANKFEEVLNNDTKIKEIIVDFWGTSDIGSKEVYDQTLQVQEAISNAISKRVTEDKDYVHLDYSDYPGDVQTSLTRMAFNSIFPIFVDLIPASLLAREALAVEAQMEFPSRRKMYTGITFLGQKDVAERIIHGFDQVSRYQSAKVTKEAQMHAINRAAELISAKLTSVEEPEYTPYEKASDVINSNNITNQGIPDEPTSGVQKTPSDGFLHLTLAGDWNGYISSKGGTRVPIEVSIRKEEGTMLYSGDGSYVESESDAGFVLLEGRISDGVTVKFTIKRKNQQDSENMNFEAQLSEYGLTGISGEDEWIVLQRSDDVSDDLIAENDLTNIMDSVKKQVYSELELIPPKDNGWVVNYTNMPLDTAVEMAKYLMESTIKKQHFNLELPTVGKPIHIATITPTSGFKWYEGP